MTGPIDTIREALTSAKDCDIEHLAVEALAALTEVEHQLAAWPVEAQHHNDRAVAAEQRANDLQALADDRLALMRANEKGWRAGRDELTDALRKAVASIDRWDATIGQPPDPPSAEEMLFAVRAILRAALDRHTHQPNWRTEPGDGHTHQDTLNECNAHGGPCTCGRHSLRPTDEAVT